MSRFFDYARKLVDGQPIEFSSKSYEKAFNDAKLPEYSTKHSAGADFFCAEDVKIPSIWASLPRVFKKGDSFHLFDLMHFPVGSNVVSEIEEVNSVRKLFSPTMVHTGVKAYMEEDEVLELYNRSSNPKKLGLILANGVGVVDSDYYENKDNDGEIMFAFYNILPFSVTLKAGDKIGQGVFKKFLRPTCNLNIRSDERAGGFGSTGSK